MQVRSLHFSDFLKLSRMHQAAIGLNLPYALITPDLPLPAALASYLPVNSHNSFIYICEIAGKPHAFVQARARQRRQEWEVLSLGGSDIYLENEPSLVAVLPIENFADSAQNEPALDIVNGGNNQSLVYPSHLHPFSEELEQAWSKALEFMITEAGEKGVVRVYARLDTDSPQITLFNQLGFHVYTHETLFHLHYEESLTAPETADKAVVLEQRNREVWQVQQLYAAVTPAHVQHSEQLNSRSWETHKTYLPRQVREEGWLLMDGDKAVAYARLLSYRNKHLLRLMHLVDSREKLPELVRYALTQIKAGSDTQVFCIVREYQMEQEVLLEELGFERIYGKQAVMVKHTVQYVPAMEKQLSRLREGKLELARHALPRRILSRFVKYLQQRIVTLLSN